MNVLTSTSTSSAGCGIVRRSRSVARPVMQPARRQQAPAHLLLGSKRQPAFLGSSQQHKRSVACQGLFGLGLPEIVVIAGVTALIFGPSKLPELGKGLGKTVKSFQTAAKEFEEELKAATADDKAAEDAKKPEEAKKE